MRGRTGPSSSSSSSSSSVGPPPNRMALRKHVLQDVADVPSGSQRSDHNTQEGGAPDDHRDDRDDELSSPLLPRSPRERRRREKDNKAKEMTEDEMMDLALRLSEQEASMTASRMQKEEEAVMKAIEESMGESQTRACAPLAGPEAALRLCSRRKLSYSNRKQEGVSCSPHATELNGEGREAADDSRSLKRKRRAGSPLLEMPDLSQTQKISQDSACSSDPLDLQPDSQQVSLDLQLDSQQVSLDLQPDSQQVSLDLQPDSQQVSLDLQLDSQQVSLDLQPDSQQVSLDLQPDSQQSCDSTQIDEGRSPVFPSTGCRAEVLVPRLSQNLLQSCRTSGFVLCSQDSSDDPLKSPQAQTRSPTFPQREPAVFSETEQVDDSETQLSPEGSQSPVFGRTTQHQKSQSACRLQVCNSGFKSSSQESLSSSVRSCRPRSPVFPRILDLHETLPPPDRSGVCTSPVFSDEQAEQGPVGSLSRVLDRTGKRTKIQRATAQIREDKKTDPAPGVTCHVTPSSDEELTEVIRDSSETELSSDMKLLWSDDDDADVTPAAVASPSPVFPEERAVDRADGQTASLNHTTGTNGGDCSQQTSTLRARPSPAQLSGGAVSRFWQAEGRCITIGGVPFCPRGLNPDSYTQVILAQMEVYEKSLKQAQRCLLRKVEWGEAVLPQIEVQTLCLIFL
ncbi:BRCA1-A complex subunit RAP80 [Labrus bergylta]|uniref:BRCA1-A complex subunit RAP80 n=1 Tax=Labrus bergylta TaxID=56723 RepID=UPI003313F949